MPLIDMPVTTGKSTKLVVSLDKALNADLLQYCEFVTADGGDVPAASTVAKQMLKHVLTNDKDFAAWKKRKPASKSAPAMELNGSEPGYSTAS